MQNMESVNSKKPPIDLAILIWSGSRFGGAERRFSRLAAYLATQPEKAQITIYCLSITLVPLSYLGLNPKSLTIVPFDCNKSSGLLAKLDKLWALIKLIFTWRIRNHDHIFLASNPYLIPYIVTRFSLILPKISVAMVDPFHSRYSPRWERYLTKKTLDKVYSVDCLSDGVRAAFNMSVDERNKGKINIAPCSFTDYSKVLTSPIRDIDVALIGRFVPAKGHELLERIADSLSQYEIHVCGSGPLRLEIPGAKIYETDNPFEILSRAKISLSLQLLDNYPSQVVLESMASGCAIIATDTGETRKFLDESCAVLIPYRSDALLTAIHSLLSNPEECYRLGQAAKKRALTDHSIERYAEYFLASVLA